MQNRTSGMFFDTFTISKIWGFLTPKKASYLKILKLTVKIDGLIKFQTAK